MRYLLAVLLLAGGVQAQTSVPIVIDTSKFTMQVPVTQKVKDAAGVWWEVSGTLTVKPTAPPVGINEAPLKIEKYADAKGLPLGMVAPGQVVTILGSGFGAEPGEVTWGGLDGLSVSLWSDTKIIASLPPAIPMPVGLVTVRRPDGAWGAGLWFLGGRTMGP